MKDEGLRRALHGAGIGCLLLVAPAAAQETWPVRSVRLVVPSSPGGGTDIYARLLAAGLGDALKQQFIVENRPGASGNIGAEIAAKAAPDGYTILISANPALVINPSLYKNLPYNAERDFAPVARGVVSPLVFTSHPSVPVKTVAALVALAKREPGKLTYGSAGSGSTTNLVVKLLEEQTGARFVHIPYKGIGQALQGLLRGELAFCACDLSSVHTHIKAGRMVPLAATQAAPHLPGTPSLAQAGYPKVEAMASFSIAAPTGTPPAVIQRLSVEINRIMKTPAFREKLDAQALIPIFDTPEDFAASLRRERSRWAEVIRRNNITAE